MLKLVQDTPASAEEAPISIGLDELCRLAAQEMLRTALLVERQAYLDTHADVVDQTGKRLVVGNGYAKERQVTTGAGMVEVLSLIHISNIALKDESNQNIGLLIRWSERRVSSMMPPWPANIIAKIVPLAMGGNSHGMIIRLRRSPERKKRRLK